MLPEYLDHEEKNITARRPTVLNGIRISGHACLEEKKYTIGTELVVSCNATMGSVVEACGPRP
jgi:hypothetical protein